MEWKAGLAIIIVSLAIAANGVYLATQSPRLGVQGGAVQGVVDLCVRTGYTVNLSTCPDQPLQSTSRTDNSYVCNVSVTYAGDDGPPMTMVYDDLTEGLTVNRTGNYSFFINATHYAVGNHSIDLYFNLNKGSCSIQTNKTYNFSVQPVNDPPNLTQRIPSTSIKPGKTVEEFFISEHFYDLEDGNNLTWNVSGENPYEVDFDDDAVIITNPSGNCDETSMYFTATDSGNMSTDSNMVTVQSRCDDEASSGSSSSSGGGGGGSIGTSQTTQCEPDWQCQDWEDCQPSGNRSRECYDQNACDEDNYRRVFYESCNYIAHCYDGEQNYDETGVDCGGEDCDPCTEATCNDNTQNQGETGIDCGGPCEPCEPEPTCNDNTQNQGETGVDCGGPCEPCEQVNTPAPVDNEDDWPVTAVSVGVTSVSAGLAAFAFRRRIHEYMTRAAWYITKQRQASKTILLNTDAARRLLKGTDDAIHDLKLYVGSIDRDEPIIQEALDLCIAYVQSTLNVSRAYTEDDLDDAIHANDIPDDLAQAIKDFALYTHEQERRHEAMQPTEIRQLLYEVRALTVNTSNASLTDAVTATPRDPDETDDDEFDVEYENALLSLQYQAIAPAKKRYVELSRDTEERSEDQRRKQDRLRNYVTYLLSWVEQ